MAKRLWSETSALLWKVQMISDALTVSNNNHTA